MSFLLRNNRRNKDSNPVGAAPRRPAFGLDRRIIPEPRNPSLLRRKSQQTNSRSTQGTFDYGGQVQIQRQVQVQRPTTVSTKNATATKQQQKQDTGVITMSEVLEDLRVLEMQQRDSQRKLANARITKDNRLQQQAALEVQLERNKYANGELRAQIRQFRDFLSCGTRELGTRRLAGSRAGDDIKAFEQQLKQGLQCQRTNTSLVRKISSLIIGLQNKEAILQRLNAESKEKCSLLEQDCIDAKRSEENLRKSIQNEVSEAQNLANEVAQIRGKSTALEEELLSAQSSEESTRLRVQAMDAELESERKRHGDAMDDLQAQIKKHEHDTVACEVEQKELASQIENLSAELLKKKEQVVAIQKKEGHSPSSFTNDFKEVVPVFDKKKFSAILETAQSSVNTKRSENEELRSKLDSMRASIQQSKEDAEKNRKETKILVDATTSEEAAQKARSEEISSFQERLEKERSEVVELRKSSLDLQEEYKMESAQNADRIAEIDEDIKKEQEVVESLSKQIAEYEEKEKALEESFQADCSDRNACLKAKKEAIQELEADCARTEEEEKAGYKEVEMKYKTELEKAEKKRDAQLARLKVAKEKLFEQYPSLKEIVCEYDSSMTVEEQAAEALCDLADGLQAKLEAAESAREERDEEKREAIRKAAEAEEAVRKKEELRREARKKRLAEIQREEEKERARNESLIDTLLAEDEEKSPASSLQRIQGSGSGSSHKSKKRSSKKRRNSDFYDPLDLERVLSDTESVSPAEPRLLLPNFEDHQDPMSPQPSTCGTQGIEKRVHWKDQDRLEDSPGAVSAKSQSKSETSKSLRRSRKYGLSSENKSASTTPSSSRSSKPFETRTSSNPEALDDLLNSKATESRTSSGNVDDFDDLLNSESIEDVPSKQSKSTKSTSSRASGSNKSSSSRKSPKLDQYEDLLNSESNEVESSSSRSKKACTSRSRRSSKSISSRTSPKLNVDYNVPSEASGSSSKSNRSPKDPTSRTSRSKKAGASSILGAESIEDITVATDELDDFLPEKDSKGASEEFLADESTEAQSKPVVKKTNRRRSIPSKQKEKSYFDSLMAVPDTSTRKVHDPSEAKRRKKKKSSAESRSLDDFTSGDLDVDERRKKKLREDRLSYDKDAGADSSLGGRTKSRTKKYGSVRSKDDKSKKSPKEHKSDADSRTKSSAYHFGDDNSYKYRSKDKKEGKGEKVSKGRKSLDKPRSSSSSLQPKDKEIAKSQSSKGSRGSTKSRGSSSAPKTKSSKEGSTLSLATSSRLRKVAAGSKKTEGSKKRKLSATTASQVSDATGRSQKSRRRKKNQTAVSKTSKSGITEGSYDFHF